MVDQASYDQWYHKTPLKKKIFCLSISHNSSVSRNREKEAWKWKQSTLVFGCILLSDNARNVFFLHINSFCGGGDALLDDVLHVIGWIEADLSILEPPFAPTLIVLLANFYEFISCGGGGGVGGRDDCGWLLLSHSYGGGRGPQEEKEKVREILFRVSKWRIKLTEQRRKKKRKKCVNKISTLQLKSIWSKSKGRE